ncbi:SusC/RagA family TonB-linked outer membrane protein [uncultured Bacteroides sp.]|uniref:SusC/RagA family TonB-linked outer membrane protein n=1 Tax=uncultured Bacteroides sp. TaxID=162156 RepID=UPI002AA74651|nr:SusC/RagA family TonB-linked outer membrane protein [uncultured Bacteroides sp.]
MKNQPLKEGLDQVGKLSGFRMNYSLSLVTAYQNISLTKGQRTVAETLNLLLAKTNLTYNISNDKILIVSKPQEHLQQQRTTYTAFQKNIQIAGMVTDMEKSPLPSVTVRLKDSDIGALTDLEGRYLITVPDNMNNPVLVFSFVGMKTQEVRYAGKNVNIVMQENLNTLDDVVVTGIFTKKKSSYTGAVKVISSEDLELFRGRDIFTTLNNIDPSFNIVENNALGADPNRLPDVQIRGAGNLPSLNQLQDQTSTVLNTPLIILNGFETTLQRMMDLNDQEISSISILKDGAATSLYGSRGANGIIVITTKDPEGGKLRLSIRSEASLNLPDLSSYHLLNARDKLELERLSGYYESATKDAAANIDLQQYYNQVLAEVSRGVNTDWLAKPLRTAIEQTHNIKLEGGDRIFQYAISAQYKDLEGVMKESGRKTFNGGIDLAYRHQKLLFRNYLSIGHTNSQESPYGAFSQYAELNPYWKPYDENGKIVRYFSPYNRNYWVQTGDVRFSGAYPNPMYDATLNTYDKTENTSIINNFAIEWKPLNELIFRGSVSLTGDMGNHDDFKPANHSDFAGYSDEDLFRKGRYAYSNTKGFSYALNFSANYTKVFAEKHSLFAGVNLDITQNQSRTYSFVAEGFPDESIDFLGMALQYEQDGSPGGSESTIRRIGTVANANYTYDNRYLLDLSYRVDGASLYGTNSRFAPFWSAGTGWNLQNESFIKNNLKFVDRMRLRMSYGTTGSQNFNPYQAQATYQYYTDDRYNMWMGAYQIALGNKDLKWQKRNKYNLGFELGLFGDRFILEADLYKEKTSNLLSDLELPYSNGFTSYTENVGKLENKGFELSATVWLLRDVKQRISWSVTGNITHDKDKIVKLSEAMKATSEKLALVSTGSTPNHILREGDSQNTIYVVPSLGIDPSTGKELFLTKNGEVTYTWNASDRVAVGNLMPKYRGNFSTMLRYKDFTLNVSFGYRFGGQIYNSTLRDKVEVNNKLLNVDERVFTDRWKQPGDRTFFKGINDYSIMAPTSRFVQDENTLTCQSASLRYEMRAKKWLESMGAQYISLTASTGELFYLSTVKRERGTNYPYTRQLLMSLSLMF